MNSQSYPVLKEHENFREQYKNSLWQQLVRTGGKDAVVVICAGSHRPCVTG